MKTSFKYGIIAGLFSGLLFYAEFFSGISEQSAGLFSIAGTALLLCFSIFIYLRKIATPELNGFYTIGYGFKKSMALVAACAITMAIFTFIFFSFINPDYIDELVKDGIVKLRNSGVSETEIQLAAIDFRSFHSPLLESLKSMIRIFLMGTFFSLIISLLVKRIK